MTWVCTTCGVEKPVSDYWKQTNKRGHMGECKVCSRKRNKAWVATNRDSYRAMNLAATHRYRADYRSRLLDYARRRSAKKGMEFDLVVDDLEWPSECPILGIPMASRFGAGGNAGAHDGAPSLDRIDNAKGYIKGNVIVVSYRANRIKSDATVAEMKAVARFYERLEAEQAGQATMPTMQPHSEKQTGQVSVGDEDAGGMGLVLSQSGLRLQGRN